VVVLFFGSKEKYPKENAAQNPITGFKAACALPWALGNEFALQVRSVVVIW
jgi:hypothetical protein